MAEDVNVFFYGLFMDVDLLRNMGTNPRDVQIAELLGFDIDIPYFAHIVRNPKTSVVGTLATLTHGEVDSLYDQPKYRDYRRRRLLVKNDQGQQVPALCYILDRPVDIELSGDDPGYAPKLHALAATLGLPQWYVDRLGEFVDQPG